MIKKFFLSIAIMFLGGCSLFSDNVPVLTDAEYADYAKNVTIADQGDNYIIYEYRNIRVDDLAVLAALYCNDHNSTRAYLGNITLYHNNARRVKFICH